MERSEGTMDVIYLDNNATTRVAPEVLAAMRPYLDEEYFNPSSIYDAAKGPANAIDDARRTVARLLGGVRPDEILFTGCATESNNTAVFGTVAANAGRTHVITTGVEHPAIYEVAKELERRGLEVDFVPVDDQGRLDMAHYVRVLRPDTLLVSVMHANNETGVICPVADIARIAKETDEEIVVHTDATQTAGKLTLDLRGDLEHVDLLSFSGHKLHAPKGIGVLFVRRGTRCRPYLMGGHQESGRRAGTENVASIVGLARALDLAMEDHDGAEARIRCLRDRLETGLVERIPWVQVNGAGAERLSNTLNLSIHFVEGEGMLYQLSAEGICASSGSACTSGSLEPSHVLRAMHIPFTAIHGSIRFSLSRYTTDDEVDRVLEVFPTIVANLRRMSPYWDAASDAPRSEALGMLESTDPEHVKA
jgi:cysteine desulfurase